MLEVRFDYIATITKISDEELDLVAKDGTEMEYAYRVYEIPGIPRSIFAEDSEDIKSLIEKSVWEASINDGNVELSDISSSIVKAFIEDQDGEDYEDEGETIIRVIHDGLEYNTSDITSLPEDHNADQIFDMLTINVKAKLNEVSINDDEEIFSSNELEEARNRIQELLK